MTQETMHRKKLACTVTTRRETEGHVHTVPREGKETHNDEGGPGSLAMLHLALERAGAPVKEDGELRPCGDAMREGSGPKVKGGSVMGSNSRLPRHLPSCGSVSPSWCFCFFWEVLNLSTLCPSPKH